MHTWTETISDGVLLDHTTDYRIDLHANSNSFEPDKTWWSVLVILADASIDMFARSAEAYAGDLLIPVAYDADDRSRVFKRQPVAVYARRRLIREMNRADNTFFVAGLHLGAITPERYLDFDAQAPDEIAIDVPAGSVLCAVIDDGIAIAHDLLRSAPTKTRVEHISLFEAVPRPGDRASVGRSLAKADIDAALAECTHNGLLDESALYQALGVIDWKADTVSPVARRVSHGTFVTAMAAGAPMQDACVTRPVICVSLPSRVVEDTTGRDSLPVLYLSFHILIKQAQRCRLPDGSPAPVVYNFSFGNAAGPHDGTGLFAALFDYYFGAERLSGMAEQKSWLMLPAGNANLSRLHAVAECKRDTHLDLCVQPDDRTPSAVQIWLPTGPCEGGNESVRVKVTTPRGDQRTIAAKPGRAASLRDGNRDEIARLSCEFDGDITRRRLVTLSVHPTAAQDGNVPLAPAGTWRIEIERRDGDLAEAINVWIRRDETLPSTRSGGRQAWFSNDDYTRFDRFGLPLPIDPPDTISPVRRAITLSGFATGSAPVVVAAYNERDRQLSSYSAAGPLVTRDAPAQPTREGPDLAAKGDDSRLRAGIVGAGSASGSWVRLSGTSVAAPLVARSAANDITDWTGSAREWSHCAAEHSPFELKDGSLPTRSGIGGIKIPY